VSGLLAARHRRRQYEAGPIADRFIQSEVSAHVAGEPSAERQSQSDSRGGVGRLGGGLGERSEQTSGPMSGDARAVVAHADQAQPVVDARRNGDGLVPAVSGVLAGVVDEVQEDLLDHRHLHPDRGIGAVIAKSFARIFYRNAINTGLPIFESAQAVDGIEAGHDVSVDMEAGTVENLTTGQTYKVAPFPKRLAHIIEAGGLIEHTRRRIASK